MGNDWASLWSCMRKHRQDPQSVCVFFFPLGSISAYIKEPIWIQELLPVKCIKKNSIPTFPSNHFLEALFQNIALMLPVWPQIFNRRRSKFKPASSVIRAPAEGPVEAGEEGHMFPQPGWWQATPNPPSGNQPTVSTWKTTDRDQNGAAVHLAGAWFPFDLGVSELRADVMLNTRHPLHLV